MSIESFDAANITIQSELQLQEASDANNVLALEVHQDYIDVNGSDIAIGGAGIVLGAIAGITILSRTRNTR